jgi:hypothetical protein
MLQQDESLPVSNANGAVEMLPVISMTFFYNF